MDKGEHSHKLHFDTNAIHAGQDPRRWTSRDITPPISLSTTFLQKSPADHYGYEYSRIGNPTRTCLEECLAALEYAKYGVCFSSGMAAIHNVTHLLDSGDHILSFDCLYGGTDELFRTCVMPRGIDVSFVDCTDLKEVEANIRPNTKLVWIETPSNPLMKVVDIQAVSDIVKKTSNALVAVDNTFMSAYFQNPLLLGADIVVHSLTKYMNGHSDVVMGAVCTNNTEVYDRLRFFQGAAGAVPSSFDCYLVSRGLKTLPVRMERHMQNGLTVAHYLERHPSVEKVLHPGLPSHPQYAVAKKQCSGFSGMVSFYIKGGLQEAKDFLSKLKVFSLADSLGCVESLGELPSVMTHASLSVEQRMALGITDNFIRLSVGLEHIDDLIHDLEQALKKAVQ